MLETYRQLLSSTRHVMEKRLPLHVTKARLTNTCDKATIAVMVAELDKLEKLYSPHMAPAGKEERVRGLSPAEQVELIGPREERGCTYGSLRAEVDVLGPEEERGRTYGSLRVEERSCHPPYPTVDWSAIRFKPSLPSPVQCPILGASQDPDVYMEKQAAWHNSTYNLHSAQNPFGSLPGYHTSRGVVAVPTTPVSGWLYSMELRNWFLHACPPGVRRRGARGQRR